MEKGCPKGKSGVKYMIPGAKVKNHDVLAQEWFYGLMTRPDMSIKVERKLHDMRILVELWEYEVRNNSYGIFLPQHLFYYTCYAQKKQFTPFRANGRLL